MDYHIFGKAGGIENEEVDTIGTVLDLELRDVVGSIVVHLDSWVNRLAELRIGRIGDFGDAYVAGTTSTANDEVVDGHTIAKGGSCRSRDWRGEDKSELEVLTKFTTDGAIGSNIIGIVGAIDRSTSPSVLFVIPVVIGEIVLRIPTDVGVINLLPLA